MRRTYEFIALCSLVLGLWAACLGFIAHQRLAGDIRGFLLPGLRYYHSVGFDDIALFGPRGYDGEFYAMLAPDPFLLRQETAWGLDAPSYRSTRVGVPLLAWVLAMGEPRLAIYNHLLLCWVLGVAGVLLVGAWLWSEGRSPLWAVALIPAAGLATSLLRGTPDGAANALLLGTLWLHHRGRRVPSLLLLGLAVLVRETSLLAVPVMAYTKWRYRRPRATLAYALAPAAVFALWQARLYLRFGPNRVGLAGTIGVPLAWLGGKWHAIQSRGSLWLSPESWGVLAILAVLAAAVLVALRPSGTATGHLFLVWTVAALFLSAKVYVELFAFGRVLILLPFLALLLALHEASWWRRGLFLSVPLFFALAGGALVRDELLAAGTRSVPIRMATGIGVKGAGFPNGVPLAAPAGGLKPGRQEKVAYLIPVVHDPPSARPAWITDVSLENRGASQASVLFEYLKADGRNYPWPCRIRLFPRQKLVLGDALQRLFATTERGALRTTVEGGEVTILARTHAAGVTGSDSDWMPPVLSDSASTAPVAAEAAFDHGVDGRRGAPAAVYLLNVSDDAIRLDGSVGPRGGQRSRRGSITLPPWRFAEIGNLATEPPATGAAAVELEVAPASDGARFLACLALFDPGSGKARIVWPSPLDHR